MQVEEFVAKLKQYYNPQPSKFDSDTERLYERTLDRFEGHQLTLILERVYQSCQWMPKLSQIFGCATDLLIGTAVAKGGQADPGCEVCRGVGWEVVTCHEVTTKKAYEAVTRCACTGFPQLIPHAMGNGWIVEFNGKPVPKQGAPEQEEVIPF